MAEYWEPEFGAPLRPHVDCPRCGVDAEVGSSFDQAWCCLCGWGGSLTEMHTKPPQRISGGLMFYEVDEAIREMAAVGLACLTLATGAGERGEAKFHDECDEKMLRTAFGLTQREYREWLAVIRAEGWVKWTNDGHYHGNMSHYSAMQVLGRTKIHLSMFLPVFAKLREFR